MSIFYRSTLFCLLLLVGCKSDDTLTRIRKAELLCRKSSPEEQAKGLVQFNSIVTDDPENTEALIGRGNCYEEQDNPSEALGDYLAALKLYPQHVRATAFTANAYRRLGEQKQAIEYLNRAVQMAPGEAWIRHLLGKTYEEFGSPELAEEPYKKAVEFSPNDHEFRLDLGAHYERGGDNAKAIEQYRAVLELFNGLSSRAKERQQIEEKIVSLGG